MITRDICIVGAGPGGIGAALRLQQLGIPCTLIERARLPRDKVCGDAISGKFTTVLNRMDPALLDDFSRFAQRLPTRRARIVAPSGRDLVVNLPQIRIEGFGLLRRSKRLRTFLPEIYAHAEVRAQLGKPMYWLRRLFLEKTP